MAVGECVGRVSVRFVRRGPPAKGCGLVAKEKQEQNLLWSYQEELSTPKILVLAQ